MRTPTRTAIVSWLVLVIGLALLAGLVSADQGPSHSLSNNIESQDYYTYIPTIMLPVASNVPLANGGFEQGPVVWTEYSSNGFPLIYHRDDLPISPFSGLWAAWLAGLDDEISYLEQEATVPSDRSTLAYFHWVASIDSCGYDFAYVRVNGSTVESYDLCHNTGGWVYHSVDLSSFAGQNVSLQLRTETDFSLPSALFIDNVTFQSSATNGGSPETVPSSPQMEELPAFEKRPQPTT